MIDTSSKRSGKLSHQYKANCTLSLGLPGGRARVGKGGKEGDNRVIPHLSSRHDPEDLEELGDCVWKTFGVQRRGGHAGEG